MHSYKQRNEYFNNLKAALLKPSKPYTYCIDHQMNYQPSHCFIEVPYSPFALKGVLAYIEYATFDLTASNNYSLNEEEFMEIVNIFYMPVTILAEQPFRHYYRIDLYENWDQFSDYDFLSNMPELYRANLLDYVHAMSIRNGWARGIAQ